MSSQTVTFHSPTDNLRLTVTPTRRRMNDKQEWETVPGEVIEFRNGRFITSDSSELSFLRGHPNLGKLFHEQGAESGRVADNGSKLVSKITELAIARNADAISDILVEERSTASRPEVLAAAESALQALLGEVPPPPPAPEHELERVRATPAAGPAVIPVGEGDQPISQGPNQPPAGAVQPPPPAQVPATPPPPATGPDSPELTAPPSSAPLQERARKLGFDEAALQLPPEQLAPLVDQAEGKQQG